MNRRRKKEKQVKGARWENQVRALSWTSNHMIQAAIRSRKWDFFWTVEEGGRLGEERKAEPKRKVSWHYSYSTCKWAWRDQCFISCLDRLLFLRCDIFSSWSEQCWGEQDRNRGAERRGSKRVSSGKSWPQSWLYDPGQESILLRTGTCSNACVWRNVAVSTCYSLSGLESDLRV